MSSRGSSFLMQLHTPTKELETQHPQTLPTFSFQSFHRDDMQGVDLHPPPFHQKSESQNPILSEPVRPGSSRPSLSSQRSKKSKKISVEDILAMRRVEAGSRTEQREYPGFQPIRLTQSPIPDDRAWPTYRFGQDGWTQV